MLRENSPQNLDRPVFLVGHARAGSTFLGSILYLHPDVGPKPASLRPYGSRISAIESIEDPNQHYEHAYTMEQKDIWFDYFPGKDSFTTMGDECVCNDLAHLSTDQTAELITRLTSELTEKRFLSKAPTNSFRINALRELFPGAKFIVLYRHPCEVISSYINWSVRPTYRQLGYFKAITKLSVPWRQTVDFLEQNRRNDEFVIKYDDLIDRYQETVVALFQFLELELHDYVFDVPVVDKRDRWKEKMPFWVKQFMKLMLSQEIRTYMALESTIETAR